MKWIILCLLAFMLIISSVVVMFETETRRGLSGSESWDLREDELEKEGDVDAGSIRPSILISDETFAALCELVFFLAFLITFLVLFLVFKEGMKDSSPPPSLIKRYRLEKPDVHTNHYSTFTCYKV